MILTNRLFEREKPSKEAKSIYIFCEGIKREFQYFDYFKELDSRINVEIYKLHPHDDNSPTGLLSIAKKSILKTKKNPNPKYSFQKNDEVWIVLDTDRNKHKSRKPKIREVYDFCRGKEGWYAAQSNPCFEVWLSYHKSTERLKFEGDETCKKWKQKVDSLFSGGFDPRRHPILIGDAIENSEDNFGTKSDAPIKGSTEVFMLGKVINRVLKKKINRVRSRINQDN